MCCFILNILKLLKRKPCPPPPPCLSPPPPPVGPAGLQPSRKAPE